MTFYELLDKLVELRKTVGNEALKQDIFSISVEANDTIVVRLGTDIIIPKEKK